MIFWVVNSPKYQSNPRACLVDTFSAGNHNFEAFLGNKAKSPIFTMRPKMRSPVQKMQFCTDFLIFTRMLQELATRAKNEIWVIWTKLFCFSQLWRPGKCLIWSKSDACSAQRPILAKNGYFHTFSLFSRKQLQASAENNFEHFFTPLLHFQIVKQHTSMLGWHIAGRTSRFWRTFRM